MKNSILDYKTNNFDALRVQWMCSFPHTGRSPHMSQHMRWRLISAHNRGVFCLWTLLVKHQPRQCCQPAFAAPPFTLNLTHSLWWRQWAFCHLLSSANSTSNYGPTTNLITVAEEIGLIRFISIRPDWSSQIKFYSSQVRAACHIWSQPALFEAR